MVLILANFEQQTIVRRDEIRAAVLNLPRPHIRGIQMIRYNPHRVIATSLAHASGSSAPVTSHGLFYHDREYSVIVLFRFHDRASFYHVLYHEIGHFVFLKFLTQGQRNRWMYEIRKQQPRSVTKYAIKNVREDFAECYAFWKHQPQVLARFEERYRFFSDRSVQTRLSYSTLFRVRRLDAALTRPARLRNPTIQLTSGPMSLLLTEIEHRRFSAVGLFHPAISVYCLQTMPARPHVPPGIRGSRDPRGPVCPEVIQRPSGPFLFPGSGSR